MDVLADNIMNAFDEPEYNIPIYKKSKNVRDILVLSGGSIKGVAHVGALKALTIKGYAQHFKKIVGTSAGALVAGLYVIGYTPDELFYFINNFNVSKLQNINLLNFTRHFGCDDGKKAKYALYKLLIAKGYDKNITMKELYEKTNIELIITTIKIRPFTEYFISHDTHPDVKLVDAIIMSVSIPLLFIPTDKFGGMCIDGSFPNIYPVNLFKNETYRVIGVCLFSEQHEEQHRSKTISYIHDVIYCMLEGLKGIMSKQYSHCTISINLKSSSSIDFSINKDTARDYFNEGFIQTLKFIDDLENS